MTAPATAHSEALYRRGCRCEACRWARTVAEKRRHCGDWTRGWVPVEQAQQALQQLRDKGWTQAEISRATGMDRTSLHRIQTRAYGQARAHTVNTIRALISEPPPSPRRLQGRPRVPVLGTRRRLRALARMGWTSGWMAEQLGVSKALIQSIVGDGVETVDAEVATHADRLFDQWALKVGPSDTARARAARKGWPPPLAWDDDDLDNPTARPKGVAA